MGHRTREEHQRWDGTTWITEASKQLVSTTDARGITVTRIHDALDRVITDDNYPDTGGHPPKVVKLRVT